MHRRDRVFCVAVYLNKDPTPGRWHTPMADLMRRIPQEVSPLVSTTPQQ